jgi:hypothetical protein
VVNLQGSNIGASSCAVFVVPTTVGIAATLSELRHDLGAKVSLAYSTLALGHVCIIHSPLDWVEPIRKVGTLRDFQGGKKGALNGSEVIRPQTGGNVPAVQ